MNHRHLRWITLVIVGILIRASTTPALAMPPTGYSETYEYDPGLLDCGGYSLQYLATVQLDGKVYYDQDGTPVRTEFLGKEYARVWNIDNPDLFLEGNDSYHGSDDLVEGGWTERGLQWDIIVPGHGRVLFFAGNFAVDGDGNIVKWTGRPTFDYEEELCQLLAP